MPKGIPLTEEEQERRRREIFDASVHLFLEKGFNETTMREIADAAGIGKSTLYDYFPSKEDILISYFADQLRILTGRAAAIAGQDLDVIEKLKKIMRMHLDYLVDNKKSYLKLSTESQRLSLEAQHKIQAERHAYQDLLRSLIDEGIRQKMLKPVNSLFASRGIITLLSLAVFTSRPTGTPEEMLQDAMTIFFTGIEG